ncbi:flagellar hook-length control protein FliK [Paenibacillus arenilitoris]|uniref:Flagellar hook-length control protein FliK n=1 Tax=Paenibacillus arenilitoris TaxID=2772299 RepID=A0A927H6N0_9BACL|nr:flagellar hook-length control protein FliK [Paenibacillus arenilitoris]MBD2870736.1 flagellar hook-length control protein FliK [Paenibacillus arenilitoris]
MEMIVSQSVTTPSQTQPSTPASGASANGAGGADFQKALIRQINGGISAGGESTSPVPYLAGPAVPEAATASAGQTGTSLSDLLAIIDGLIEQLEAPTEDGGQSAETEQHDLHQLEAALDQMNALLALLGVPSAIIQPVAAAASGEDGGQASELGVQLTASLKSSLQDALLQLQAVLQQGNVKRVQQQDPTVFIGHQLQALAQLLEQEPASANNFRLKPEASVATQLFAVQSVPQPEAATMLQRLSQQAVHPAFTAVSAQQLESLAITEQAGTVIEAIPQMPHGTANAELTRGFAPLTVHATAGAAASFVAADQFAETMTGMIVQRFDVTTVNGISEAKLQLFPEHLGQVDVRISMQNGLLTAVFQTDTAMAKDMLDNQMAQLRAALQAQGITVDKLEVSQGQTDTLWSQQHQGQGGGRQHESSRQLFSGGEGADEVRFETELVEQAAVQGLGFGRGINVRA